MHLRILLPTNKWHFREYGLEQFWSLVDNRADKETASRTSVNCQLLTCSVSLLQAAYERQENPALQPHQHLP